ncbi:mitochondrial disaggregase-like [Clytia hemisphaerica]|uniref:Caseinolytic peptidase B protein n=1 Tax=Clytia hemisphaerica TaxID=252671 RepID=A0A7M5WWV9_9CNID
MSTGKLLNAFKNIGRQIYPLKIIRANTICGCLVQKSRNLAVHRVRRSRDQENFTNKDFLLPLFGGGLLAFINIANCFSDSKRNAEDLCKAASEDDLYVIKRLVAKGVDVNSKHPLGWSAIHAAAFSGNSKAMKYLIEKGADVNVCDEYTSPYKIASHKRMHVLDVVMLREECFDGLKRNADFSKFTPLHYASLRDDYETVKLLLDAGADPTMKDGRGYVPYEYADQLKPLLKDKFNEFGVKKEEREAEERRRFPIEQRFREAIVGQEGAINAVASAVRRRDNGWYDEEHPLVFLFLGSSGIGKTELAKQLAKYLHKDLNKGFIRLDMSEYQEKHEVAKLIGAPPGYIGHDQGGQLTKKLKQFPKAVVLFDEVDKAHPDVLTVLLQLFDEGRLTDGHGKTIECKDAIFVMTSNLASEDIANHAIQLRAMAKKITHDKMTNEIQDENITLGRVFKERVVYPILKRHFQRDEFLGRISEFVYFLPFSRSELSQLVSKELNVWAERAKRKHSIELQWDNDVLDILADGYDVHYGARSIKHEVERKVVNQLAAAHERGLIKAKSVVQLSVDYPNITVPIDGGDELKPSIKMKLLGESKDDPQVISMSDGVDDERPIFF